METQESITRWADDTFGPKHPAEVAARMNVEVAELEREFQERLNELGRDAQEQMSLAWSVLMNAADLPMEELGERELDASYLDDHGCAFLSKREAEDARPSLGDLLQSMTASKH